MQAGIQTTCLAVGLWEANEVRLLALPKSTPLQVVSLGTSHARSILAGHMASALMLFVGTADGSVVFCQVSAAQRATPAAAASYTPESDGAGTGDGSCAGGTADVRRVYAGSSGVALHWVPARGSTPAHVYAQSDRGLVLQEAAGAASSAGALDPLRHMPYKDRPHADSSAFLFESPLNLRA